MRYELAPLCIIFIFVLLFNTFSPVMELHSFKKHLSKLPPLRICDGTHIVPNMTHAGNMKSVYRSSVLRCLPRTSVK